MLKEDRATGFVGWVDPISVYLTKEHKHLASECIKLGNRYSDYVEALNLSGLEQRHVTLLRHSPYSREEMVVTKPMPVHQYTGLKSIALRKTVFNEREPF